MRAEVIVKEKSIGMTEARNGLPRWAEATFAIAGLVVAAPVIGLAGLGIVVFSGRPVFFRQQRVGQNGDTFNLYKLRTMTPSVGGPQITSNVDSRITRLGRFLRNTKLDELPTLWNVVRGDMSLVGPRPEVPRFVQLADPTWQKVLAVKPGITDPVTLRLRSEAELLAQIDGDTEEYYAKELQPAKLKGYVAYLEERTWRTDLKILLQTLVAVVVPRESGGQSVDGVSRLAKPENKFSNDRNHLK
jgi:lipopolysaccharide/colanic/teichoic acid biosynthesis glycosyltransferase